MRSFLFIVLTLLSIGLVLAQPQQIGGDFGRAWLREAENEQGPVSYAISGLVYADFNLNQSKDDEEMGLGNVSVRLANNHSISTATADDGYYIFEGVAAGDYLVAVLPPDGWIAPPAINLALIENVTSLNFAMTPINETPPFNQSELIMPGEIAEAGEPETATEEGREREVIEMEISPEVAEEANVSEEVELDGSTIEEADISPAEVEDGGGPIAPGRTILYVRPPGTLDVEEPPEREAPVRIIPVAPQPEAVAVEEPEVIESPVESIFPTPQPETATERPEEIEAPPGTMPGIPQPSPLAGEGESTSPEAVEAPAEDGSMEEIAGPADIQHARSTVREGSEAGPPEKALKEDLGDLAFNYPCQMKKNIDYFAVASLGYTGTPGECLTKFFKSGEGRKTEFRKIETNLGWKYEATLGGVGFCCTRIMPFNKPSYLLSSNLDEPPTWWWNVRPECEEGDHELILVISHIKDNEIINTTRWMVHVSVETPSPISAAATTTKKYGEPIFNMILKLLAGIGSAWILYEKMASRRKSKG